MVGSAIVGLVPKTKAPVPVSPVTAAARFAVVGVPRNVATFVPNPDTPLEMDFRELEFCKWNGIDYESGGYTSKSFFIDDFLEEEKETRSNC